MDFRLGGIAAGVAFVLSLLIGLLSRSTLPMLFVWPLVFAVIFFFLFILAKFLFSQFLPELLGEDSGSSLPGSMINIMEGDTNLDDPSGEGASWQANAARPDESDKTIGDISTLSEVVSKNRAAYKGTSVEQENSTGIDQNVENSYTEMGDSGEFSQSESSAKAAASGAAGEPPVKADAKPAKSKTPWYSASDDSLPDLDSIAGVFTSAASEGEPETAGYSEPSPARKTSSKGQPMEGDFSPKDIAEGIRTVLKKDKDD